MRWILYSLCLAVAAAVVLWSPLHWMAPFDDSVLASAGFQPEKGHAFIVPFTGGGPSDQQGRSSLRLRENGRDLAAHASHERIRTVGAGCFSHWGDSLYVATSDNSDPRTNGRRYDVLLPARISAHAGWLPGTLLGLATLLALAGARRVRRERRVAGNTPERNRPGPVNRSRVARLPDVAAGLVCLLAVLVAQAAWSAHAMRARLNSVAASPSVPGPVSPPSPRTIRLLDDVSALSFVPADPAAAAASGSAAELRPDVLPDLPESVSLAPGELRGCATRLDLAAGDVAELHLPVRVRRGERLRVRFVLASRDTAAPGQHVDLELPLEHVAGWQTLKLTRPLRLADRDQQLGSDVRLTDLQLGNAAPIGESLELDVGPARIVSPATRFAR